MKNKLTFFYTDSFENEYKRLKKKYPSLEEDILLFKNELIENPKAGIDLGGGLRKIRVAIASKNKGKSGGARIITFNVVCELIQHDVLLVTIYDKGEQENISIKRLKEILRRNGFIK